MTLALHVAGASNHSGLDFSPGKGSEHRLVLLV